MTTVEPVLAAYLKRLHDDYPFFIQEMWKAMGWEKHGKLDEIRLDICKFVSQDAVRDIGVLAFRAAGKSHFVTVGLSCWYLYRDCNNKVVVVAKSEDEAVKTTSLIRDCLERTPFLKHLTPKVGTLDNATAFQCGPAEPSRQPSVSAFGIGGNLEGNRAHLVLADDVETDTNTITKANRDKLVDRVTEFKQLLYKGKKEDGSPLDTRIVYVGTYHHEESLYLKLAEREINGKPAYLFQTWPLLYPKPDEKVLNLAPLLAERLRKDPLLSDRPCFPGVTETEIARLQAEGRRSFLMQQKLVCDLRESNRYPLRISDLIVMDVDPIMARTYVGYGQADHNGSTVLEIDTIGLTNEKLYGPAMIDPQLAPYQGTKAFIDPAGRGEDELAVAIVSMLSGLYWVKAVHGQPGGVNSSQLDRIALLLREWRVDECVYESNNDDYDSFGSALRLAVEKHRLRPGQNPIYPNGWACNVVAKHNTGQKEVRIRDTLEPVMSTHRLIIDKRAIAPEAGVPMTKQLQFQMSRLTMERGSLLHDDRLDALAGAVSLWTDTMDTNPTLAKQRVSDTLEERWIRSGFASSLRRDVRQPTMCPHRRRR